MANGKPALTKRFTAADALTPATLRLPATEAVSRVQVTRTGAGRVYWSARGEYYSSQSRLANRANLRLNLDREYLKLTPTRQGEKIVYEMNPLRGPVNQGDVIAVHLTLTGGDWRYLLLEDPIPSGAEIIENDNLYELTRKPDWWQYFFTRREFRDDRAAFFQTFFNNKQEHFYLLKIVNPGEFRVSPARVEPMYQPQYFATSDSARLEVTR
jgi:uncharacterized protein YfaS (alpha-2-macroglobulin family)